MFSFFLSPLVLLRNSKVLFACAQVCEPLIDCVWHVNFGWLSTNNPTWLQHVSSNICKKIASSHFSFCGFVVQLFLVGAQRREVCDPLSDCFLACEFWVAINEQFDMTAVCKFQYLHFLPPLTTRVHPFSMSLKTNIWIWTSESLVLTTGLLQPCSKQSRTRSIFALITTAMGFNYPTLVYEGLYNRPEPFLMQPEP